MELINGGSLRDKLREQAATGQGWPLATSLELIRQAAEALDYAHAAGMVHRDIKPDNLLLDSDASADADAPPLLKVGDFGLARLTAESHLTATGTVMGTPAYMSPEQCRGGDLDGRSDLYALGVVLYELATGRVPFIVKTPFDAVYQHLNVAPPPPRQLRPELPSVLETIILRCLAKAPQDRFPTGAALALTLQQLLGGDLAVMDSMIVPIPETELFENLAATALGAAPTPGLTPAVATLMGGTRPLIRVLDAQGATLQVLELRGARLTIGRAPDNDLHLEGQGVSRHHLSVTWDGTQVLLTDLGAANGTLLAGQQLPPSTPQTWPWRAVAQLGTYWLRLEPPVAIVTPALGSTPAAGSTAALGGGMTANFVTGSLSRSFALTERLEMRLENPASTLTPGQPTPVRLTLTNRGRTPDQINLTVSGIPESWVSSGATVLRAGEQATLTLTVLVPADTDVAAGERLVKVRARSKERPAEGAQAEGRWTVLPFQAVRVSLTPARAVGRRQAHYQISVENAGNAPARYQLAVEDDSGALAATVEPDEIELAAGERRNVRLELAQPQRLVGVTVARRFVVQAAASAGGAAAATDSASGQFVQPALLPVWMLPVLGGLLMLIVLCGLLPPPAFGSALSGLPIGFLHTGPATTAVASDGQAAANPQAKQTAIAQSAAQAAAEQTSVAAQQALLAAAAAPAATQAVLQRTVIAAQATVGQAQGTAATAQAESDISTSAIPLLAPAATETPPGATAAAATETPPDAAAAIKTTPDVVFPTDTVAPSAVPTAAATAESSTATQLVFIVQPDNATGGSAFPHQPQVYARDANGNVVTGFNDTITISIGTNPSSGVLGGTLTIPAENGIATFTDLSIDKVGTGYTLIATSNGLTSVPSDSFGITAGEPDKITATGGTPQSTLLNRPFGTPLEATVLDAGDNPVSGVVVVFSGPTTGAGLNSQGNSATTDSDGIASITVSANGIAGAYTVTANTSAGLDTPASFNLTNTTTPPPPPPTPTRTLVPPTRTTVPPTRTPVTPTRTPVTPTRTPVTPTRTPVTPTRTPVTPTRTPVTPTATVVALATTRPAA